MHADLIFAVITVVKHASYQIVFCAVAQSYCKTRLGQAETWNVQSFYLKAAVLSLSYLFHLYLNIFYEIVFNCLFK